MQGLLHFAPLGASLFADIMIRLAELLFPESIHILLSKAFSKIGRRIQGIFSLGERVIDMHGHVLWERVVQGDGLVETMGTRARQTFSRGFSSRSTAWIG